MVLSSNPQLYKHIWPDKEDEGIEWIVPESQEEMQDLIAELEGQWEDEVSLTE